MTKQALRRLVINGMILVAFTKKCVGLIVEKTIAVIKKILIKCETAEELGTVLGSLKVDAKVFQSQKELVQGVLCLKQQQREQRIIFRWLS